MTGPERFDTRQMTATSQAIDQACQKLQNNTSEIVELLGELSVCLNEAGIS